MADFNPADWYWQVGADATKFYSSANGDYVQSSDVAYQEWLGAGNAATKIASEAELGEVLAPYSIRPINASVLDAYKDTQASKLSAKDAIKVIFNHENRIRALEGKQAITANQLKQAIKDLM
jgi:hypothetical protein